MKALIIRMAGSPYVFEAADLPVSEIEPGEDLVKGAATSVNPVDWQVRKFGSSLGTTTDT